MAFPLYPGINCMAPDHCVHSRQDVVARLKAHSSPDALSLDNQRSHPLCFPAAERQIAGQLGCGRQRCPLGEWHRRSCLTPLAPAALRLQGGGFCNSDASVLRHRGEDALLHEQLLGAVEFHNLPSLQHHHPGRREQEGLNSQDPSG